MYTLKIIWIEYHELNDSELITCKKNNAVNVKTGSINVFSYSSDDLETITKKINEKMTLYRKSYNEYSVTVHKDNTILLQQDSDYYNDMYNNLFSTAIDSEGRFV